MAFDTHSGGSTKVVVIYNDGIVFIPDKKIIEIYNEALDDISSSLSQALTSDKNKITKEMFKQFFSKDSNTYYFNSSNFVRFCFEYNLFFIFVSRSCPLITPFFL